MKNSIRCGIFVVVLVFSIILSTSIVFAQPVPVTEDYIVEFLGVDYDEPANTSTWTYNLTCVGEPEISHFDFEFKTVCDPPLTAIIDAGPEPWEIKDADNPDPTTGIVGLKFDQSINKNESLVVWFTLEGLWGINDMEVWIKAGNQVPYTGPSYLPEGPACFVIPEVPLGTLGALGATFMALILVAKKNQ